MPPEDFLRHATLQAYDFAYQKIIWPIIAHTDAQTGHQHALALLEKLDQSELAQEFFTRLGEWLLPHQPTDVGGVTLSSPLILAAGFVKDKGWRTMSKLVGAVELGSFTPFPRAENDGVTLWRDETTNSTQNRRGLPNSGAQIAAKTLSLYHDELPEQFGINIASTPGETDPDQEIAQILSAFDAFIDQGVLPTWFTLNISCPNTQDDPQSRQTKAATQRLCSAVVNHLAEKNVAVPLWVKIGPNLSDEQYQVLLRVFAETGVQAVIATNTMPEPTPDDPTVIAGVGGGRLHDRAVQVAHLLLQEISKQGYNLDIIGCGGVTDAATYADFNTPAAQLLSALIFKGPLAAAQIAQEINSSSPPPPPGC